MRIGPGVQLPLPPSPPTSGITASTAPDRETLLRVASIAAGTPWTVLDGAADAVDAGAERIPLPVPLPVAGAMPNAAANPAASLAAMRDALAGAATAPGRVGAGAAPTALAQSSLAAAITLGPSASGSSALSAPGTLPLLPAAPAPSAAPVAGYGIAGARTGSPMGSWMGAIGGDRLTLSPAMAAARPDQAPLAGKPAGEFMLDLLSALSGEPRSQLQQFTSGEPATALPGAIASLATKGPNELLQLLVRGSVRGEDAKQVDLTLGLSVQRQPGAATVDAAVLDAVRAALEQLARSEIELDYPGSAAALAGHSARFQAALEPQGLWPLQSFLLSGLLILGRARDADSAVGGLDDDDDEAEADDAASDERDADAQAREAPPRARRRKPALAEVPTPLAADGGPPIISANRWLELELRHWRSQLRLWMALPPLPPLVPATPPRLDTQA